MDVTNFLRSLGLEGYEHAFRDNHVDAEVLPELTADDLINLGVASVGHRRKLLAAIAALRGDASPVVPPPAGAGTGPIPRSSDAERRQLTVMFCDLVGSTALCSRLDPEEMHEVIHAYRNAVVDVVTCFEGHIAKFMGDGVLCYFGWPHAHEDEGERAVRAGLAITRAVAGLTTPLGEALAARVGIATGLVVVGHLIGQGAAQEETVVGETPNLAARLQGLAEPGAVVVAESTRCLLGSLFELRDLGSLCLKGFAEPVRVLQVTGESRTESRFDALHGQRLVPFVNRDFDLAFLLSRWDRVRKGEGQVVLLAGEAGIGKSRLIQAFRKRLAEEPHTPLSHYGSPYHAGSALWPIIDLLERAAGFVDDDTETKLIKLEALIRQGVEDISEAAPVLAALLSIPAEGRYAPLDLSPQRQKDRTFIALLDQLAGLAVRQPVLAVYEDVHWFDPSTLELIGHIIDRVERLPVLALIVYRPDFTPPWTARPYVSSLTLNRLEHRHCAALVEQLSGPGRLPPAMLEQIVARTDGVPLFLEELTRTMLEAGLLQRAENGRTVLRRPPQMLAIPTTLHDSLMARLDRLASVKEAAQIGACIGREFSHELLAAAAERPESELRATLDQMVASGLILRHGTPPDAVYRFKHALVQDAAYQSLLKSRRQQLHGRIAILLEKRFPKIVDTAPELLAQHYTEAGQAGLAADYWLKAARRAAQTSANAEAVAHLTQGLAVLDMLPDTDVRAQQELDLQIALGATVRATKWFTAVEAKPIYHRARILAERLGATSQMVHALRGLWGISYVAGDWQRARELINCLGDAIQHTNDPVALTVAHFMLGVTLFYQSELVRARTALETALNLYDPRDHRAHVLVSGMDNGVHILNHLAPALWMLGYPDTALQIARKALDRAREQAHPISMGLALHFAGKVHEHRREWHMVGQLAEELIALGARHDFTHFQAWGVTQKGAALIGQGEVAAGIADMRQGLADLRRAGDDVWRPFYSTLLAGALRKVGRTEDGLAVLTEALALVGKGERVHEAEVHRAMGEQLLAMAGHHTEGEAHLVRAVEVARVQQAKSLELRAATSLARSWAKRGERCKAHDLLSPVYGWLTEGFDTPDLQAAKTLLDELN